MKTNEEILQEYIFDAGNSEYTYEIVTPEDALEAMKEAQKEIVKYIRESYFTNPSLSEDEIIKEIENG